MRRLPVYLLLDTSGSMKGEPIESVKVGLSTMISTLRSDPFALESVNICIITFDRDVKCLVPLTSLENLQIPEIRVPDSGPTHTGAALQYLCKCVDNDVRHSTRENKGDWMPILFLLTDGKPSDLKLYREMVEEVKKRKFACIITCAAGMNAKIEPLKLLTDNVYSLETMDSSDFIRFFKWVSMSVSTGNQSLGANDDILLPPPPPEINVIC